MLAGSAGPAGGCGYEPAAEVDPRAGRVGQRHALPDDRRPPPLAVALRPADHDRARGGWLLPARGAGLAGPGRDGLPAPLARRRRAAVADAGRHGSVGAGR